MHRYGLHALKRRFFENFTRAIRCFSGRSQHQYGGGVPFGAPHGADQCLDNGCLSCSGWPRYDAERTVEQAVTDLRLFLCRLGIFRARIQGERTVRLEYPRQPVSLGHRPT